MQCQKCCKTTRSAKQRTTASVILHVLTIKKNVEGYESRVCKYVAMPYLLLIISAMIIAITITTTATAIIVDSEIGCICVVVGLGLDVCAIGVDVVVDVRSEEHTSELQSL